MNAHGTSLIRLMCVLALAGHGAARAAATFDPDYTNPTSMVTQPVSNVGMPVGSGYLLDDGTKKVYVIDYSSLNWTGDLHSYNLSSTGVVSKTDNWDGGAKKQIQTQNSNTGNSRYIVTMNGNTKVPFRWANLSPAQQTALSASTVLDYIRGSNANEAPNGLDYRARTWVLGDIIHSTPRYWDHGTNRTVFVGANDGMLHAINADDGTERFAYIPSVLIPKLVNLKNPVYYHKYFVDGQFDARKFVDTGGNSTQSILAGALGGGGKGLFALDITLVPTSESDAASKILWEVTNATTSSGGGSCGYANLGHTYGTPQLTTLPDGTNAVVVGNGYNNTGNGHASLYLINAATGVCIAEVDTGSGTTASPNGLSAPKLIDTNLDGKADIAYAGDIDGNLWKFDLSAKSATKLFTTNPAQAITMAPGYTAHPSGGYMVTFATGRIFVAADETDTSTFYAYGIWDRPNAFSSNDTLLVQTMTERSYTGATPSVRVRTATSLVPDWTAGAGHHMGWKVALPVTGERVVADGGYVPDSVFLFMSTNPTISPTAFPPYANWWMQLNALTGGDNGTARFDLNSDNQFTSGDTVTVGTTATSPVARYMGGGVRSQLTEFSTRYFEIFLANYDVNGDPPITNVTTLGVAGGHFDFDIYQGTQTSAGTQASATIVVRSTGQTSPFPATLGDITLDGVVVIPAQTVADITNGTATGTNAATLAAAVQNGFTATLSGSTVTIKAPVGTDYNTKTLSVAAGTSAPLVNAVAGVAPVAYVAPVAPVRATGFITFTGTSTRDYKMNNDLSGSETIKVGGADAHGTNISIGSGKTAVQAAAKVVADMGPSANSYGAYVGGNSVTPLCAAKPTNVVCIVDFTSTNNGSNNGKAITVGSITGSGGLTFTTTSTAGGVTQVLEVQEVVGVAAVPQSGWTDFKPALTVASFSGGIDPTVGANTCDGNTNDCKVTLHVHEYDDKYDRTGVNMLDASDPTFDLANAIPSKSTQFKVLMSNQYLSPGVKIHLNGSPAYLYNVDAGYTPVKNFMTSSTLDVTNATQVPTYTRANVHSLALNMPIDIFSVKDWWAGALGLPEDKRAGLIPTSPKCVNKDAGAHDGNMFQPVIPPGMGGAYSPAITVPAYGALGYSNSTTPSTAKGLRHGGALTIQVVKSTIPNSAVELSIPGHPEFGWRVKSANFSTYVLAEYTTYWHHPNDDCIGDATWVKDPPPDTTAATASKAADLADAAAASDPKIGALGSGGTGVTAGTSTTTVTNPDGSTTTTTVTIVINPDGSVTTTTTITNSNGGSTTTTGTNTNYTGGVVNDQGIIGGGVTSPNGALGRVNWRELLR